MTIDSSKHYKCLSASNQEAKRSTTLASSNLLFCQRIGRLLVYLQVLVVCLIFIKLADFKTVSIRFFVIKELFGAVQKRADLVDLENAAK